VVVHVVGAVANPGLYTLPAGARAADAIAAAGGMLEGADSASLNLAAHVADGQQIQVRALGSPPEPSAPAAGGDGKLSLNRASAAELDTLPGIGPVLAARIVERRQRRGPFVTLEQLRDEKLVPAATFERIRERLTVD
jgi:competence protein ComEA